MTSLALCVILQTSVVGADALPYNEALKASHASDQPLVVLVGNNSCPGCVTMKRTVLPNLVRRGKFRDVQLTMVNTDADPGPARKLMRGTSIPQLIVFSRGEEGWTRQQLTGPQSEKTVTAVVDRAVAEQAKAPKLAELR